MAHAAGGPLQAAVDLSDKTVDAWAGEITNKWRTLIAQQQKASAIAGQVADSLQSPRGKADPRGVAKEGNLAPSATLGRSACFLLVCAQTRKDYAFWHQFNEKPSVIPGCPGLLVISLYLIHSALVLMTYFHAMQESLSHKRSACLS